MLTDITNLLRSALGAQGSSTSKSPRKPFLQSLLASFRGVAGQEDRVASLKSQGTSLRQAQVIDANAPTDTPPDEAKPLDAKDEVDNVSQTGFAINIDAARHAMPIAGSQRASLTDFGAHGAETTETERSLSSGIDRRDRATGGDRSPESRHTALPDARPGSPRRHIAPSPGFVRADLQQLVESARLAPNAGNLAVENQALGSDGPDAGSTTLDSDTAAKATDGRALAADSAQEPPSLLSYRSNSPTEELRAARLQTNQEVGAAQADRADLSRSRVSWPGADGQGVRENERMTGQDPTTKSRNDGGTRTGATKNSSRPVSPRESLNHALRMGSSAERAEIDAAPRRPAASIVNTDGATPGTEAAADSEGSTIGAVRPEQSTTSAPAAPELGVDASSKRGDQSAATSRQKHAGLDSPAAISASDAPDESSPGSWPSTMGSVAVPETGKAATSNANELSVQDSQNSARTVEGATRRAAVANGRSGNSATTTVSTDTLPAGASIVRVSSPTALPTSAVTTTMDWARLRMISRADTSTDSPASARPLKAAGRQTVGDAEQVHAAGTRPATAAGDQTNAGVTSVRENTGENASPVSLRVGDAEDGGTAPNGAKLNAELEGSPEARHARSNSSHQARTNTDAPVAATSENDAEAESTPRMPRGIRSSGVVREAQEPAPINSSGTTRTVTVAGSNTARAMADNGGSNLIASTTPSSALNSPATDAGPSIDVTDRKTGRDSRADYPGATGYGGKTSDARISNSHVHAEGRAAQDGAPGPQRQNSISRIGSASAEPTSTQDPVRDSSSQQAVSGAAASAASTVGSDEAITRRADARPTTPSREPVSATTRALHGQAAGDSADDEKAAFDGNHESGARGQSDRPIRDRSAQATPDASPFNTTPANESADGASTPYRLPRTLESLLSGLTDTLDSLATADGNPLSAAPAELRPVAPWTAGTTSRPGHLWHQPSTATPLPFSQTPLDAEGWHAIEMNLDDGDGSLVIRTQRDREVTRIALEFSDPALKHQAEQHAERLRAVLAEKYDTAIDLSLGGRGFDRGHSEPGGQSPANRIGGAGRASTEPSHRRAMTEQREGHPIQRPNEWIG